MNKKALNLLVIAVVVMTVGVVGVGIASQHSSSDGINCSVKGVIHYQVSVKNGVSNPRHTSGKLCDTLTITNLDSQTREMAFGPHEDHIPYDGIAEKTLASGKSFTITFNKTGSYHFHDHIHDDAEGFFNVYQ